jgi:hypothetical protein
MKIINHIIKLKTAAELDFIDITDKIKEKIKEKTEADGSYNFRLDGEGMTVGGYQSQKLIWDKQNNERLKILEDKLNAEPDEDDEKETLGSIVMEVIRDPVKMVQYVEIIKAIFSSQKDINKEPFKQIAQMGNATPNNDDKLDRIEAALDILGRNDDKICEHLEKLADISVKSPFKFKILLSELEKA